MQRNSWLTLFRLTTIGVACGIVLFEAFRIPPQHVFPLCFLVVLGVVASFLRVSWRGGSVGFEAVVALPAIILFRDPALVIIPALAGGLTQKLYESTRSGKLTLRAVFEPAELALSFYLVSLFYAVSVPAGASAVMKAGAYGLLAVGYLVLSLFFESTDRYLSDGEDARGVLDGLGFRAKVLLLSAPIVATEVLIYPHYDLGGLTLAFLPVLLVASVMRHETDAEKKTRQLVRRNHELSLLTESSSLLLNAAGSEETLRRLVRLLSDLTKMKACAVVTWEAAPDSPSTIFRFGECLPTDQAIEKWVDSYGFAQTAPKSATLLNPKQRSFPLSGGDAHQVIVGIQTVEVIYGLLIFETEDDAIHIPETVNLVNLLVSQTALSLQDQLLRDLMREKTAQLEKQAETMSTILDVSTGLIGEYDVDAMLTRIAQAIRRSLGFEIVVFALADPKRNEFVRRAHAGLDDIWDDVKRKHVPATEITDFFHDEFRMSNSYFVSHGRIRKGDFDLVVKHEEQRQDEWHSLDMLIVPLMSGGTLMGYLSVREPIDRRIPTLDKIQTLEIFASQAVTALQSARQYEEIKRLTFIDGLTPAFNHRFFQEALRKEVQRHERTQHAFALAMLDIDNFKAINDSFGHPVGDEILKGLVDELMLNVREIDIVARYGGEEFAIIFPEMPPDRAVDVANRLRILIAAREFPAPQTASILRITVSIGIALYPVDGTGHQELIEKADAALYQAKKNGKNQVVIATPNLLPHLRPVENA